MRIPVLLILLSWTTPAAAQAPDLSPLETTFARIVNAARGKVGVALIHLPSGRLITVRADERFPMASVVKLPIAIEVLKQVAERKLNLDRQVWIDARDIRPCCTISRRHPIGGVSKTVRELLELSMLESDNTAADLLLTLVGGPAIVERRMRTLGFTKINVNRSEGQLLLDMAGVTGAPDPAGWTLDLQRRLVADVPKPILNQARVDYLRDARDSTTPYDLALLLGRLHLGNLLPKAETNLLLNLMAHSRTGMRRLRSRLPEDIVVAHKTGTTAVVINDVGIITLPVGSVTPGHVVLSVFVADGSRIAAMERTIAQLGAAAFEFFTGKPLPPPPPPRRQRVRATRVARRT
jgi:beta-lactamase class A